MNIKDLSKKSITALMIAASVAGVVGGASLFNAVPADAQTATTAPVSSTSPTTGSNINQGGPADGQFNQSKGGHIGSNGKREELLTGDTAEKVKAAAQVAVPGGTIERVETDAEGSPYEAHMTKSDGSRVTVKVDSNFKVTSTESGAR